VQGDNLKVFFIDYGNKDTIKVQKAERADSDFFSIAPLAEMFAVTGLYPANGVSWTQAELDVLQRTLLNAEFEAEIVAGGVTGFPPLIRLLNVDYASAAAVPSVMSRWPSLPAAPQFDVGKSYTVFVTHFESVLNFWVQALCEQETLDRFHLALADSVDQGKSRCLEAKNCLPGTLCVARYKGSDQFYRAVVREIDWQGEYDVTFIDYGDSAMMSINELWPLDLKFMSLPVQVLRCCATVQSAYQGGSKLRKAFIGGCTIYIHITAASSIHHLAEIDFDDRSAVGQPVVRLPSLVGTAGLLSAVMSTFPVPKYAHSNLAEGLAHSICISSIEPDGSFYCQLLSDAKRLNQLMLELSSVNLLPVNGAVVDGMACVVRSPTDGCIYRAHVCMAVCAVCNILAFRVSF